MVFGIAKGHRRLSRIRILLSMMAALACGVGLLRGEGVAPVTEPSQSESVRLRIAWGGGQPSLWRGKITALQGDLIQPRPLGSDPENAGMFLTDQGPERPTKELVLNPLRPQLYQVVDVTLRGQKATRLRIELQNEVSSEPTVHETSLADLVKGPTNIPLEGTNNRLLVQQASGDLLELAFSRDHLIFAPGETFQIQVRPKVVVGPNEPYRLTAELAASTGGAPLWRNQQLLRANQEGVLPPVESLRLTVPESEGVFHLSLRLVSNKAATPFTSDEETSRAIQFVVCDPTISSRAGAAEWREIISVDPSQPRWWERLRPLANWNRTTGPLGELLRAGQGTRGVIANRTCTVIPANGWQAYPLVVSRLDQPHLLEFESSPDAPQATALCIYEADPQGNIYPRIAAGAFQHQSVPGESTTETQKYRLLFWPRTRNPVLFVANRHPSLSSHLIRYRVLAGPAHLPAMFPSENRIGQRQTIAYFDEPGFVDMFCAQDVVDQASQRPLSDWRTFQTGAQRLTEYLRYTGQSGATIPVIADGCTLYPDPSLLPGTRFDNGVYFYDGRDPLQKDICELIFRHFDREGLTLVPAMRFTGLIPELEHELRAAGRDAAGIELVHRDGATWRQQRGLRRGGGAFYNPLDSRVQNSILKIVRRFLDRYAQHASFRGLRIDLLPECSIIPPDVDWGMDAKTTSEFRAWLAHTRPSDSLPQELTPDQILSEMWRTEWQEWRAIQLASFYQRLTDELKRVRPEATLFLSPVRLAYANPIQASLEPALPPKRNLTAGLAQIGLDLRRLGAVPGLIFLYPQLLPSSVDIRERGIPHELANDANFHETLPAQFAQQIVSHQRTISQVWPLGREVSPDRGGPRMLSDPIVAVPLDRTNGVMPPASVTNLNTRDARVFFMGGSRPSLGNLESLQAFNLVLRQIPSTEGVLVETTETNSPSLRKVTRGNYTYFIVTNDTFWSQDVTVQLAGDTSATPVAISRDIQHAEVHKTPAGWEWKVHLDANDLAALRVATADMRILQTDLQWPEELESEIGSAVEDFVRRIGALNDPQPSLLPWDASFESQSDGELAGWESSQITGVQVGRDEAEFHQGSASARIESSGPQAWIRSPPFPVPFTGRISVKIWLKATAQTSVPIRLACEGILDGQPYYRFAQIDPGQVRGGTNGWNPFVLIMDDLPASGMRDLHVRVDLLGKGTIWLDAIEAFDLTFLPEELTELSELAAIAELQFRKGDYKACHRTLNSYWAQLMVEHAPLPEFPVADAAVTAPAESNEMATTQKAVPPSQTNPRPDPSQPSVRVVDRLRRWIPLPVRPRR